MPDELNQISASMAIRLADITLIWDRIQTPQQASDGTVPKQDDVRLLLSLGFEF